MNATTALAVLKQNSLFADLPVAVLERIASIASVRNFVEQQSVFRTGDSGNALYGIVSGTVRISVEASDGREIFLNLLGHGESFGEIALLDGGRRTASATCTEPSSLVIVQRSQFLTLLQHEPDVAIQIIELLCRRLRFTSAAVEDNAFLDLEQRLVKRLLEIADKHADKTDDQAWLLRLSQDELAHFVGASRQVVNQHLQTFQRAGVLSLARGRIVIHDSERLAQLAKVRA